MRVFHRTAHVDAILARGFRDHEDSYTTNRLHRGVWVSAQEPLTANEGATGNDVLVLDLADAEIEFYEWVEDGKPYREFLVPADVLNGYPVTRLWECGGCEQSAVADALPVAWKREREAGPAGLGTGPWFYVCGECREIEDERQRSEWRGDRGL